MKEIPPEIEETQLRDRLKEVQRRIDLANHNIQMKYNLASSPKTSSELEELNAEKDLIEKKLESFPSK